MHFVKIHVNPDHSLLICARRPSSSSIPYYLTYSTPSVISRPQLLVAVLLSKIRLLPAARMAVLSYKSCFITEVIRYPNREAGKIQ